MRVDCDVCRNTYDFPPCSSCEPEVHPYNIAVLRIYETCSDQYIMGPEGPIAIDAAYIEYVLKHFFKVKKKYRLEFSLLVREFFGYILKRQAIARDNT